MTNTKFKKIILVTAILGGIFFGTSVQGETKYLPYDKCSPPCLQYDFCEMTPHPGKEADYSCEKRFADGLSCIDSVQCQSGNCGIGQGDEKKCLPPFAQETGEGYLKIAPTVPKLEVDVPTLQPFTAKGMEKPDDEGNIYIPFIGQYIVGIYKWAVLVAGIIATIMIMLGGFTYLTSGGDATRAGAGKERITSAVFGLILLLGSYLMLYLLNPELVQFKSLKINVIKTVNLEDMVVENLGAGKEVGVPKKLENPIYDAIFQKFSACAPVDWRVLKTMAYKESGLDTDIVNKYGFTGLFQTKEENCQMVLNKYPFWKDKCNNLKDPEVNTAVGAQMLKASIKLINETCPNSSIVEKLSLIYLGHNSGPGAIKYAMNPANGGCDALSIQKGIIKFWEQHKNGKFAGQSLGKKRFDYAMSVANLITSQGVKDLEAAELVFDCPL
ncbi:MAG: transglycosylase SLT domain-containing protein [Candidatus Magasanikbacteria bacterium]|nr:transglycosylase SLT domain-containing protein [Candidatus Magasanikbacteria bacterium]